MPGLWPAPREHQSCASASTRCSVRASREISRTGISKKHGDLPLDISTVGLVDAGGPPAPRVSWLRRSSVGLRSRAVDKGRAGRPRCGGSPVLELQAVQAAAPARMH
eukprot:COSAG03_NODE_2341_length_2867_cov_19.367052_2_plen_107_part_00